MEKQIQGPADVTLSGPGTSLSDYLRQNNILGFLPVAAYVCDMEGFIKTYNDLAAGLWGRRPALGQKEERYSGAYRLYHTDGTYLPHHESPPAACLEDGLPRINIELIVERPDASRVHVSMSVAPLRNEEGRPIGIINCFNDITAQKDAIKELRKNEEQYHKMIEEVEDYAIILLDPNGMILNWNKGAEKIKGYREQDIVGKSFEEFYLPEDRQKGLPLVLLRQAREKGKAIHEGWRKRSDGSAFWGSIVLTALHDDQGNIIGFSKVTRDLTERKLAEDRLKEYLVQLEFQNKELDQFVYAASHDLKEPLRKIHLYNSFIIGNPSNSLDAKSSEYLDRSIKATERMKGLIEDLLTYSRATANVEGYEDLNLNQVLDELISFYKEEFDQKNVSIEIENPGIIWAIPFQIKQLLSNLIDNAVKYRHPERKALITIRHELVNGDTIMEYKADPQKQYHKISVADNGIGFDTKYAGKIFEIFQRLDPTTGAKGSGIGLAICKKIVQNHNGFIRATGKPGEGASFVIYLPST